MWMCLGREVVSREIFSFWKSLEPHNFLQFLVTTVTQQSIIGKEKIVDSCASNSYPLTVCYVRIVAKKLWNNLWS